MTPIKILYLSHTRQIGGAEVCLLTLLRGLNRTLYEPVVVFPRDAPPGLLPKEVTQLGIRTRFTPLEWWIRPPADRALPEPLLADRVTALAGLMLEEQPGLVHTNTAVICEGALAAQQCGVPHVWHVHEVLNNHPSLHSLLPLPLTQWIMGILSARVVAVSDTVRNNLAPHITPTRLTRLWNGIAAPPMLPSGRTSVRQELGLADETCLAVSVGGLLPEKDYPLLLAAAFQVRQHGVPMHFVIAGAGRPAAIRALKRQIAALGLNTHVHYLGCREDVPRLIAESDFLVVSSRVESFSLVALEAMAAGKPIVSTDCGGPSEILGESGGGLLVPIGDAFQMADQIRRLALNPGERARRGSLAFARWEAEFREECYVSRFQALYQEVLQNSASGPAPDIKAALSSMDVYQTLHDQSLSLARLRAPLRWPITQMRKRAGRELLRRQAIKKGWA